MIYLLLLSENWNGIADSYVLIASSSKISLHLNCRFNLDWVVPSIQFEHLSDRKKFACLFVTEEILCNIEHERTMVHYCTHLCQQWTKTSTMLQSSLNV